jgi:hypothetical protein
MTPKKDEFIPVSQSLGKKLDFGFFSFWQAIYFGITFMGGFFSLSP